MKAEIGDRLVVHGRHLDDGARVGTILEVHGANGAPPYVVAWEGEHEQTVVIPGPDAYVEHAADAGAV